LNAFPAAQARKRQGLTLEQAAKRLRMSTATLRRYERGEGPNYYTAGKIARLYGCSAFGDMTEQGIACQTNKPRLFLVK
jgi:transcriptional regulator with XRE-family HTH domain